jgi:hypothetical protein
MLASHPASILNQISRRVGKQNRFSPNASRSSLLVAQHGGIRGEGNPGAKAIVTRPAASSSAALAAEAHGIPRHRFAARTNRPEGLGL